MLKFFIKKYKEEKGEMGFGTQILLFLVVLFIAWILMGGSQKPVENKSLFVPISQSQ